jgi:hypothetical protein
MGGNHKLLYFNKSDANSHPMAVLVETLIGSDKTDGMALFTGGGTEPSAQGHYP